MTIRISGTWTALITPFTANDQINEQGLKKNIADQIAAGISGILPLGTTGESPTLSAEEKEQVIKISVAAAKGKVPVMVGTGTNATKSTIENTIIAKELGADAVLIVTPYYNKPTQEGIYQHFKAVAQACDLPIMVYNIMGRCGVNIETATMLRLAEIPQIVSVKEASGNINQIADVINEVKTARPDFTVLSGDDVLTLPLVSMGGDGVVSVVSNLIPKQLVEMVQAALSGKYDQARQIHYKYLPFFKSAFIETNPIPVKVAMELLGLPAGHCRLPLSEISENNLQKLKASLKEIALLK